MIADKARLSMNQMTSPALKAPGISPSSGKLSAAEQAKLKEACQDFESIFVKQMLKSMRETLSEDTLMDGGMAEDIFEDMLYDKYAEKMTSTAGFGVSDMMYRQLTGKNL